ERTTAPAPVHRLGSDHHDKIPRAHPAGRRSQPSRRGVGFCSQLTRRVTFCGRIALEPMAVTGADLPLLERSANAKDCPKATFIVAGSKHRAGCEPTFAKDVVNAEIAP